MFFLSLVSLGVGFILNEEASVKRLSRKLFYEHEGWLVVENGKGIWLISAACVLAFLKGYGWGVVLQSGGAPGWHLAGCLYVLGNVLAVHRINGLFYTPWLALTGMILSCNTAVFQGLLTFWAVSWLLTRKIKTGLKLWRSFFCLFVIIFMEFPELLVWIVTFFLACIFSRRQSPFAAGLIKYFEKISGWRVTT